MKTDKIRNALGTFGFTNDVSGATAELKALEESHAEMAAALSRFVMNQGRTQGHTYACDNGSDDDAKCTGRCRTARAALRKAGLL